MDQRLVMLGLDVIHKLGEALPNLDNAEGFQLRLEFFGYLAATLIATIPDAAARKDLIEAFAADVVRISDGIADFPLQSQGIH